MMHKHYQEKIVGFDLIPVLVECHKELASIDVGDDI
jgi:hypothetical protein